MSIENSKNMFNIILGFAENIWNKAFFLLTFSKIKIGLRNLLEQKENIYFFSKIETKL
jgi:hypothetical protein